MSGRNRNLDSTDKDTSTDSSDFPSYAESLRTGVNYRNIKTSKPDENLETNEEYSAPEINEGVLSLFDSARLAELKAKYSGSHAEKKDNDSTIKRNSMLNSKKPVKRRLRKSASSKKSKPIHQTSEESDSDINSKVSVAVETSDPEQEVRNRLNEVRRKAEPFLNEIDNFEQLETSNEYNYIEKSLMKLEEVLDRMSEDIKGSTKLISETKEVYGYISEIYAKLDHKLKANQARLGDIEMS